MLSLCIYTNMQEGSREPIYSPNSILSIHRWFDRGEAIPIVNRLQRNVQRNVEDTTAYFYLQSHSIRDCNDRVSGVNDSVRCTCNCVNLYIRCQYACTTIRRIKDFRTKGNLQFYVTCVKVSYFLPYEVKFVFGSSQANGKEKT
jgi:hypothetical protein